MRLSKLLNNLYPIDPSVDCDVSRLILDSRQVKSGDLFIALQGFQIDGRQFIPGAIQRGAKAILVDATSADEMLTWQDQIPLIPIFQLRNKIAAMAAIFYEFPATKLRLIGVTGTSGKTSCTHFIAQALQALQIPCGIIGTLGSGFYGKLGEAGLTTPDAISLQAELHHFREQGAKAIAMEVSSHSIEQGRINDLPFEISIFTNLSQDHLDYHGDMETYARVKKRFMTDFPAKHVILNIEDSYGRQWAEEVSGTKSVYGYSTKKPTPTHFPVIYADQVQLTMLGIKAQVHTPWGVGEMSLPLIGQFNLSNGLAALTALCLYGVPLPQSLGALSKLATVPGRMQIVTEIDAPLVIVDYAHKPDALEKVLQALRAHTKGKLICVFGCGGERDRGKRPLMAKIAEQLADHVIVTNDNPRHENPEAIAAEIIAGFVDPKRVTLQLDRSKAIQNGIQLGSINDCILIAGKGAEHYQQIGDNKIPFDDVAQVRTHLANLKQKL